MNVPAIISNNKKTIIAIGAVSVVLVVIYIVIKYLKQSVIKQNSSKMRTSGKGRNIIKKFEGLRLTAYHCSAGALTIGWGHTGADVYEGKTITQAEAERLFDGDLVRFERIIQGLNVDLTQNQFDALVSFAFNTGATTSTLYSLVKKNPSNPAIAAEFRRWRLAGGKIVQGLVNRREDEIKLYFS